MGKLYWPLIALVGILTVAGCGTTQMREAPKTLEQICQETPSAPACEFL